MAYTAHEDSAPRDGPADLTGDEGITLPTHKGTQDSNVVDLTGDSDDEPKMILNAQKSNIIDLDDDDDDEDLRRAIALSVQEMKDSNLQDEAVSDETSEKYAVEMSSSDKSGPTLSAEEPDPKNNNIASNTAPPNAFGILGLDRKKLEEERLARVAKRKAEIAISPPPLQRDAKLGRRDVSPNNNDPKSSWSKSQLTSTTSQPPAKTVDTAAQIMKAEAKPRKMMQALSVPSVRFPRGAVKKTWAFGYPRDGSEIKIEEVLQSADLELAILSAFQWNMEWVFTKFRTRDTRFLLMMQAKEESTRQQYEEETANMSNIRLCFPPMDGQVKCMHSKLMLLFHPGYLRIVVPSANLVPYDWGEQGGVMENTVFLIDLPKVSDDAAASGSKTHFYEELVYFLKASTVHDNLIAKLSSFDFKETSRYAFVHTIGGSHIGESFRRTGHCGLGRAVSSLDLVTHEPVNIDYVTSSVGSLSYEFMRSIYLSAQGDDGRIEYALRTTKAFPVTTGLDRPVQGTTGAEWKNRFRVYYPSDQTVSQSKGGYGDAGTICFQQRWFDGENFPRHVLHDCISRRNGLLMHNKMMFIRPANGNPITRSDGSSCAGWAYVGSANLSESAWGRIVHDRSRKEPKLNCRNWESGVLVPIVCEVESSSSTASSNQSEEEEDIAQVFGTTVPVPMRVPAPHLGTDLKPFFAW